jgi:hypothetical protein
LSLQWKTRGEIIEEKYIFIEILLLKRNKEWSSDESFPGYNSEITRNIVHVACYQCKARDMIHTRNGWILDQYLWNLENKQVEFVF